MKAKLYLPDANKIIRSKGLGADGAVQQEFTKIVNNRIARYMPASEAMVLSSKLKRITGPDEITVFGPYAQYQYEGKVMIDPKINAAGFMTPEGWRSRKGCVKVRTNRDLDFERSRAKNPQAGPRWDRALSANEGKAMAADLQRFINRRGGR